MARLRDQVAQRGTIGVGSASQPPAPVSPRATPGTAVCQRPHDYNTASTLDQVKYQIGRSFCGKLSGDVHSVTQSNTRIASTQRYIIGLRQRA